MNFGKYLMGIGGEGVIVEVDECKFGKKKYNKGHGIKIVWVEGLVERTAKRKIIVSVWREETV